MVRLHVQDSFFAMLEGFVYAISLPTLMLLDGAFSFRSHGILKTRFNAPNGGRCSMLDLGARLLVALE